jgi:hypothetical protein
MADCGRMVVAAAVMVAAQLASAPSLIVTLNKLLVAAGVPEDRCRQHHCLYAAMATLTSCFIMHISIMFLKCS